MSPSEFGLLNQLAPPLGVTQWINAAGEPMADYDLANMPGRYKLLFCFQDACPGCHRSGFPTLIKLIEAFRISPVISFAAIHTVFEEFSANTAERGFANQRRYALPIPFGHDAGLNNSGSLLMQRYKNGGTPWFILIDPEGVVVFNHYYLDAGRLIDTLQQAERTAPQALPPGTLTWAGVLRLAQEGNPAPPHRLELSAAEWRQRLTAKQFAVMRQKGTEPAHSSALCQLFEAGRYACAGCGSELFDAGNKFDSKSGWPSFTQAITPKAIAYHTDDSHGMQRIETTCNVCDAHLGHVFPDGPAPGGLRYCINAQALRKL